MQSTSSVRAFILLLLLTLPAVISGSDVIPPCDELHGKLFPGGKPIGQPLSSAHPEVRIVRVESGQEADAAFFGLCLKNRITRRMYKGEEWLVCRLSQRYGGWLCYTRRPLRGWRVVGTVYIRSPLLNGWGFAEIRFVETIKCR